MVFKTKDFFIDRDTATAARISNRLDNLYDDLNRCTDSCCSQASKRIRSENFLIKEADRIFMDPSATRSEKAFAEIVYEIVSGFQADEWVKNNGEDNAEWE
jgi:hypothetical protein